MLFLLACSPEPVSLPSDTGAAEAPFGFSPSSLELGVAATAQLRVTGAAMDIAVSCPAWLSLTLTDPAAAGDVAIVTAAPGYSPPLEGTCVAQAADGQAAEVFVELVSR